jgi:superfamily II DNA helicase RecQ
MPMRLKFFCVPLDYSNDVEKELNAFLASHQIVSIRHEVISRGDRSCWAVSVEYTIGTSSVGPSQKKALSRARVDYKSVLGKEEFVIFSDLRLLRKDIATEEGVPVYAVFSNEQLASMALRRCTTRDSLSSIDGISTAKLDKYAERLIEVIQRDRNMSLS